MQRYGKSPSPWWKNQEDGRKESLTFRLFRKKRITEWPQRKESGSTGLFLSSLCFQEHYFFYNSFLIIMCPEKDIQPCPGLERDRGLLHCEAITCRTPRGNTCFSLHFNFSQVDGKCIGVPFTTFHVMCRKRNRSLKMAH